MSYTDDLRTLASRIPAELIDFGQPRDVASPPTQASSNFITNKEQGDWAERLVFAAVNRMSKKFVAVRYGKSDDLIAGEKGFDDFFNDFQRELDEIGKRPDILIMPRSAFREEWGYDISHRPQEEVAEYVRQAVAGIEVRSSAFLIGRYEDYMHHRTAENTRIALQAKETLLREYQDVLSLPNRRKYLAILDGITEETVSAADFKVPGWHSSSRLEEANALFRKLKNALTAIQKRDYLSITPKVEDLKVVMKWTETFHVPHFYFQVFFDRVYGISFSRILEIMSNSDNDGELFSVEKDIKNQNKQTIKIRTQAATEIAHRVDEPSHHSKRKEMERGRLLFYVSFEGGKAYLDVEALKRLLGIDDEF